MTETSAEAQLADEVMAAIEPFLVQFGVAFPKTRSVEIMSAVMSIVDRALLARAPEGVKE